VKKISFGGGEITLFVPWTWLGVFYGNYANAIPVKSNFTHACPERTQDIIGRFRSTIRGSAELRTAQSNRTKYFLGGLEVCRTTRCHSRNSRLSAAHSIPLSMSRIIQSAFVFYGAGRCRLRSWCCCGLCASDIEGLLSRSVNQKNLRANGSKLGGLDIYLPRCVGMLLPVQSGGPVAAVGRAALVREHGAAWAGCCIADEVPMTRNGRFPLRCFPNACILQEGAASSPAGSMRSCWPQATLTYNNCILQESTAIPDPAQVWEPLAWRCPKHVGKISWQKWGPETSILSKLGPRPRLWTLHTGRSPPQGSIRSAWRN
jgi:hypothetical protein